MASKKGKINKSYILLIQLYFVYFATAINDVHVKV